MTNDVINFGVFADSKTRECPENGSKDCVTSVMIPRYVAVGPSVGLASSTRMLKTSGSPASSTPSSAAWCPVCPFCSWDRRPGRDTTLREKSSMMLLPPPAWVAASCARPQWRSRPGEMRNCKHDVFIGYARPNKFNMFLDNFRIKYWIELNIYQYLFSIERKTQFKFI